VLPGYGRQEPSDRSTQACQEVPFHKVRLRITDFLGLMHEKHVIHSLTELDVTSPREHIRQHKARTGEGLSFTSFFITCLARAVDEDKNMHAYRRGNRLVLFEDVDVTTVVEHEVDEVRIATPYIVRAANRKSLREIHREIRASQEQKTREFTKMPWYESWFFSLPSPFRQSLFKVVGRSPHWRKKMQGTVMVTAVGMFGKGSAWGIPMTVYTLCLTLGGIALKPGVVQGRIEPREYLSLTVSVDHDIVDGAPLARFLARLKELVESGYGLGEQAG
jgi:pyruvate/2-oxoglutarate dehydrogenase complex dihydrolipoamide acyltransferase (E2) component